MHEKKHRIPTHVLYKIFIYVALIALAISIIVPVAWVFMASLKKNAEFIEMLQLAGTSYAMSNAAPGIPYYSTYVTDSVEDVLEDILAQVR